MPTTFANETLMSLQSFAASETDRRIDKLENRLEEGFENVQCSM
jgi:hypothetical protein